MCAIGSYDVLGMVDDQRVLSSALGKQLNRRLVGAGSVARIGADERAALVQETDLDDNALLLAALPWARRWARPPLSKLYVGAVVLGGSGQIYLGANFEFAGLPLGEAIHAEQAAIINAWVGGETELQIIAASAMPCGHCRQFMLELPPPRPRILAPGLASTDLDTLLPWPFGPSELGKEPTLLGASSPGLTFVENGAENSLARLALAAAARSSAPYTGSLAGVALATAEGSSAAAGVAESVAYNPTIGPMQAALVVMHLSGGDITRVREAVLVELIGASVTHRHSAQRLLNTVAEGVDLGYLTMTRAAT
jgi:cytidine deaminase